MNSKTREEKGLYPNKLNNANNSDTKIQYRLTKEARNIINWMDLAKQYQKWKSQMLKQSMEEEKQP